MMKRRTGRRILSVLLALVMMLSPSARVGFCIGYGHGEKNQLG